VVILDWRFETGVKMIYSAIAAAALLSFFGATAHFGTDLPELQAIDLPPRTISSSIFIKGNRGLILAGTQSPPPNYFYSDYKLRPFQMDSSGVVLGPTAPSPTNFFMHTFNSNDAAVDCELDIPGPPDTHGRHRLQLTFISLDGTCTISTIDVPTSWDPLVLKDTYFCLTPCILGNRLFVEFYAGAKPDQPRYATIDISDPAHPRLISDEPLGWDFGGWRLSGENEKEDGNPHRPVVRLPQIAGLSPRERLGLLRFSAFDGEHVFEILSDHIAEYALTNLTETQASFEEVNHYDISFLDRMLGGWGQMQLQQVNGFLYVLRYSSGPIESTVCVYDTLASKPMRQVAHFAAPGLRAFGVLPDGRIIAAGDKLWLVAAPQRAAK
jgi:hypothetical protein